MGNQTRFSILEPAALIHYTTLALGFNIFLEATVKDLEDVPPEPGFWKLVVINQCSRDNSQMPFRGLGSQHGKDHMGPLQRQLRRGEYGLFKYSPMFESNFVQISKQGGPIEIHNQEQIVTVGITASSPLLLIPDTLLLAQPIYLPEYPTLLQVTKFHRNHQVKYELSRLFPLRLLKISIHNAEKQQLRFKLVSGRTFYLQLCPESYKREELFDAWTRVIQLLWPPSETKFERKESDPIRSSPSPRPMAPSPKPTSVSMTAWSDLTITQSLMEDIGKRNTSEAESPVKDPAPPPNAEEEAELASPLPSQSCETTEASEEELVERSPSHRTQPGEKGRHESSPPSRRRFIKESHSSRSRSRQTGPTRKSSTLLSLIRSCSWGNPRQKRQGVRSRSKEKKRSTR